MNPISSLAMIVQAFKKNVAKEVAGMSGGELAAQLGGIPELRDCRLIAVTGHGPEALPSPSPFHGYFQKPVPTDALLDYLAGIPPQPTRPMAAVA